jgi:Domain of unknown function (DUF5103)
MKNIYFFIILYYLWACVPVPSTVDTPDTDDKSNLKPFRTDNFVYEAVIKTIQLYPNFNLEDYKKYHEPPIISLDQKTPLILEFDQLNPTPQNYHVKIFHCNADWKVSSLLEIEYLNDINDFLIRDYQVSFNTKVSYLHYQWTLPKVKVSGNYLLTVYREGDENDRIFTRRFVVFENKVGIQAEIKASNHPSLRDENQQIEFKITYPQLDIRNPREEIKVNLRQNYRWNKSIQDLKPLYVRETDKVLEYNHFNQENNFKGLNEYRRFDMRSIRYLGLRVGGLSKTDSGFVVEVETDLSRKNDAYFYQLDYNGNFVIGHYESGRGTLEADYVITRFHLQSSQPFDKDVFVLGAFNDWQASPECKMIYIPEKKCYQVYIRLKQGEYNYSYAIGEDSQSPDEVSLEGTHQATENQYDLLVYFRPFGARGDRVIGYAKIKR